MKSYRKINRLRTCNGTNPMLIRQLSFESQNFHFLAVASQRFKASEGPKQAPRLATRSSSPASSTHPGPATPKSSRSSESSSHELEPDAGLMPAIVRTVSNVSSMLSGLTNSVSRSPSLMSHGPSFAATHSSSQVSSNSSGRVSSSASSISAQTLVQSATGSASSGSQRTLVSADGASFRSDSSEPGLSSLSTVEMLERWSVEPDSRRLDPSYRVHSRLAAEPQRVTPARAAKAKKFD